MSSLAAAALTALAPKHRLDLSRLEMEMRDYYCEWLLKLGQSEPYQPKRRLDVPAEEVAVR